METFSYKAVDASGKDVKELWKPRAGMKQPER